MSMHPKVLQLDKIGEEGLEAFKKICEIDDGCHLANEDVISVVENYEGVIVKSGNRINKEVLRAAKKLRFIARAGSGVDNIDTEFLHNKGIALITSAEGNARSVAEYVLGTTILISHELLNSHIGAKHNNFQRHLWQGRNINTLSIGIIGYGVIGKEVVKIMSPICKEILVYSNKKENEENFPENVHLVSSVEELVANVDVISIHTSLNPSTEYLFNEKLFDKTRPGAILINTARGKIINDDALLKAFDSGIIKYAILDSLFPDPNYNVDSIMNTYSHFLVHHPKVFYTPHIAAGTKDALNEVSVNLAIKVKQYLNEKNLH